jgi:diguanylate cyclase (GGDEF)-like protein
VHLSHLVHPQHRFALVFAAGLLGLALLGLLAIQWAAGALPSQNPHFLTWHQCLEILAILVAGLIFTVGWTTYGLHRQRNILLVSCAFLGVAIADTSHMLSYPGMPSFFTPSGPEKAIHFWLLARYLAAVSLLLVACFPWRLVEEQRRPFQAPWRLLGLCGVLAVVVPAHWVFLAHPHWVPRTFIPEIGLTPFKQAAEYGLIGLHLLSMILLLRQLRERSSFNVALLFGALGLMVMSELLFTRYAQVTDLYNLAGHVYKVLAYLLLYRVMFVGTILAPYRALHETREHAHAVIDAIPDLLFEFDAKGLCLRVHIPDNYRQIDDLPYMLHRTLDEALPTDAANACRLALNEARLQGVSNGRQLRLEQAGGVVHFELSAARMYKGFQQRFVVLARDISQRILDQQRIQQLAHFDALTGLPNRTLFAARFAQALEICERNQQPLAVLFMDLDHFKHVNDQLGHQVGDSLLVAVAQRLRDLLRDEDSVARQGGDEFILALPFASADSAAQVAERVQAELAQPMEVHGHSLQIGASIGIAMFPEDGRDQDTLFRHADSAMYRVKQEGRGHHAFFTAELQARLTRAQLLGSALRQALANDELELHYQPQLDMREGRLVGAEALLRWRHPVLGNIAPTEFIPVAESTGQIVEIGAWVLRTAITQMSRWLAAGYPAEMRMAVNLSMAQFRVPGLFELVCATLRESGLPASNLELELTESLTTPDSASVGREMQRLAERGVHLAIDDFGTGYSSLGYLKHLPVHRLKIDRSFVRDLHNDASDQRIVQAILGIAEGLGLETMAEGIETHEQLALLLRLGCQEVQGYLFSRPLPADQFEVWVRDAGWLSAHGSEESSYCYEI